MEKQKTEKCAHPACSCVVEEGSTYCGTYCHDSGKNETELACNCGHKGCQTSEMIGAA
jgi:hypothetical protein